MTFEARSRRRWQACEQGQYTASCFEVADCLQNAWSIDLYNTSKIGYHECSPFASTQLGIKITSASRQSCWGLNGQYTKNAIG